MKRPPESLLPAPSLSGRLREYGDVLTGYADACLERFFLKRPGYQTVSWESAVVSLELWSGQGVAEILDEPALAAVEEHTRRLLESIRGSDPFLRRWAADSVFARCCYLICRLRRPSVVVETGVAYGVSSAFILKALEENGGGMLHSVDLPPPRRRAERFWGIAVPEDLRARWRLHRGSSKRVLGRLLGELQAVDLFVHDSMHTYRNMLREFGAVWPHLRSGGVVLADDVERNGAFGELRKGSPPLWIVVGDRERSPLHGRAAPVTFGIAVK